MRFSPPACVVKVLLPSFALLCGSAGSHASPAEQAAATLTGQSSREWVFKEWRKMMSAEPGCIEGKSYRFASDNSLKVEECIKGKIRESAKKWSVEESGLDVVIRIDGAPYILLFKEAGDKHLMLLRKPSASKTSPTIDEVFRLSAD